jgi:signal peptidase I
MKRLPTWSKKLLAIVSQIFFLILILAGGLVIYHNVYFTPIKIVGNSMEPTLKHQEFGVMDQRGDISEKVTRFDIIILQQNPEINRYLIKRLIGLPGETIHLNLSGELLVNDVLVEQDFFQDSPNQLATCLNPNAYGCQPLTLTEDQFFVMGDNRGFSTDSRVFGPISRSELVGKLIAIEGICLTPSPTDDDPDACQNRQYYWPRLYL